MSKNLFYRCSRIDFGQPEPESERTVSFSFASDAPVEMWHGVEILSHDNEAVDLGRINEIGAVLVNHNPDKIVGRIDDAWVDSGKTYARVTFDADAESEIAFKKLQSGSLRGVSVGYRVNSAVRISESQDWNGVQGPLIVAEKWTPYEISLTPIPADASVGARSLDSVPVRELKSKEHYLNILARHKNGED